MSERLNNFEEVDPDSQFFDSLFPNSNSSNSCNYYTLDELNNSIINSSLNLSLINCNIRSFSANGTAFEAILHSISNRPKFIVFTETWNSPDSFNLCNFEGYNAIHTFRNGARGGGVSIFCENSFNIEKLESLSMCTETIESCAGRIYINGEYLVIIGIYRPHSDSIDNFTVVLESLLNNDLLSPANKTSMVLLAGDMNVNLTDVDS